MLSFNSTESNHFCSFYFQTVQIEDLIGIRKSSFGTAVLDFRWQDHERPRKSFESQCQGRDDRSLGNQDRR